MNLQHIKQKANNQGFTIVELLIVIVVIGILAAITIVAYNGIQNRARHTSAENAAATVIRKAEAYNAIQASYPADLDAFNSGPSESELEGISLGTPTPQNGQNTVLYAQCGSGTGASVTHYDYIAGSLPTGAGSAQFTAGTGC